MINTDIANGIKEMPTIEPERKTDGDTISRQAAIDAIIDAQEEKDE